MKNKLLILLLFVTALSACVPATGLAGGKVKPNVIFLMDGLNLLDSEKRPASFCALHERKAEAAFMWRTADHKLILRMRRRADDDASKYTANDIIGGEFYDLVNDPQEWRDLYSAPAVHLETRERMTTELLAFLKSHRKLTNFSQRK